jgi:hypothetical protein
LYALVPNELRITMVEVRMNLTQPIISDESEVLFSAYGVGWGYCAFALPPDAICEELGAANASKRQLLLAFELGKRRILQVVNRRSLPDTGKRITLSAADFRGD